MKCKFCGMEFSPLERPYISKQAGMEGEYHWNCFVAVCRDRVPDGTEVFDVPNFTGDSEEIDFERSPTGSGG